MEWEPRWVSTAGDEIDLSRTVEFVTPLSNHAATWSQAPDTLPPIGDRTPTDLVERILFSLI